MHIDIIYMCVRACVYIFIWTEKKYYYILPIKMKKKFIIFLFFRVILPKCENQMSKDEFYLM